MICGRKAAGGCPPAESHVQALWGWEVSHVLGRWRLVVDASPRLFSALMMSVRDTTPTAMPSPSQTTARGVVGFTRISDASEIVDFRLSTARRRRASARMWCTRTIRSASLWRCGNPVPGVRMFLDQTGGHLIATGVLRSHRLPLRGLTRLDWSRAQRRDKVTAVGTPTTDVTLEHPCRTHPLYQAPLAAAYSSPASSRPPRAETQPPQRPFTKEDFTP